MTAFYEVMRDDIEEKDASSAESLEMAPARRGSRERERGRVHKCAGTKAPSRAHRAQSRASSRIHRGGLRAGSRDTDGKADGRQAGKADGEAKEEAPA
eukprot:CAMPEP_0185390056 /NCGR_PEP_ID=MMETSP1364-20130426/71527_1 /TAXON_ID=38817 /ORGANISM="Gephyrocapsa oceanica, Strain RCC1303" /LENGTH=97 /DNA_ID=CAMNT_0027992029 /DNA_START=51 /DNA_END=341 /DNA_ORIENTATION=+